MKKNNLRILRLCSFFAAVFLLTSPLSAQSAWKTEMYAQHNWQSFSALPAAGNTIDLKNVDYLLLQAAIFYATNEQRTKNGIAPYIFASGLTMASQEHAQDMVSEDFFSHTSPLPGKTSFSDRSAKYGVPSGLAGENIAVSFAMEYEAGKSFYPPSQNGGYFSYDYKGTPIKIYTYWGFGQSAIQQWMESAGHKRNILNEGFKYMGAGAYLDRIADRDDMPKFKAVQNFAAANSPNEIDYTAIEMPKTVIKDVADNNTGGKNDDRNETDENKANDSDKNKGDEKKPRKKEDKPDRTKYRRFSVALGTEMQFTYGTPADWPQKSDKNLLGLGFNGLLGYRFGYKGSYKRPHIFGVFAKTGYYGEAAQNRIAATQGLPPLVPGLKYPGVSYAEFEAGFLLRSWFRLSGGFGMQNFTASYSSQDMAEYLTFTSGFRVNFKKIKWNVDFTGIYGNDYTKFMLRPSTGLAIQLDFIKF